MDKNNSVDTNKIINEYLDGAWWTRENSNIDRSVMALNNRLAEAAIKKWWLTQIYDEEIRRAYKDRLFHIHNLGHKTVYCVGWNIEDLLLKGFKGRLGRQTSGPAKHLRSALGHVYNFLYVLQGEAAGAQALSNFDTYLAPFIAKDGLNQEQVEQIIQEFIFEMNVPTRVGGQQPFTNITLDQTMPKFIENDNVIIGGELTDDTYGSFQREMDMFNEAWWKCRIEGDYEGRTQPFPIETLNATKDFNWEDETLFKAIALRGSPYISNFINSDMNPEDVRSMCCRLKIDNTILEKRGGGYFGSSPLTGSIGVVTMNLPLMAYLSKDEDIFFEILETAMDIAIRSLLIKRETIERNILNGLYPYSRVYLESVNERFGKYWKNHFSTIGLVGMNEAILNLFDTDILSKTGLMFTLRVLNFMRERALQYQEETGDMVNLEATPAESTSYRLAMEDRRQYPDIITAGGDVPYYTNSTQIPVNTDMSLGEYLLHQNQIQPLYTGGTVFHIWNGETVPPWRAVSHILKRVAENYELPYYTYSPTTSVCPVHGFISGEHWTCPNCGKKCEVWQRVTGYFSPVHLWNDGKQQEFKERVNFSI